MNTREYLGQIHRLNLMISNTSRDVQRFRELAVSITAPMDKERVQTSGTADIVGNNVSEYVTIQQRGDIKAWTEARNIIIKQIAGMDNSDYYDILYKKYALEDNVNNIAKTMNCTTGQAYKILRKATTAFEEKYQKQYCDFVK